MMRGEDAKRERRERAELARARRELAEASEQIAGLESKIGVMVKGLLSMSESGKLSAIIETKKRIEEYRADRETLIRVVSRREKKIKELEMYESARQARRTNHA